MIHVFNYRDKNYIYDVGSGSLHECDKATADFLRAKEGEEVDITYLTDEQLAKKKKWAAIWDKITTGLLIFLMATPVIILAYIFLWFIFR